MAPKKGGGKKKAAAKSKAKKGKKLNTLDPKADFDKPVKKPRQARLPTMEDPEIEELESLAEGYADALKRRTDALTDEKSFKKDILNKMKELGKMIYHHNGTTIQRSIESEKVRVIIKKKTTEEEAGPSAPAPQEQPEEEQQG